MEHVPAHLLAKRNSFIAEYEIQCQRNHRKFAWLIRHTMIVRLPTTVAQNDEFVSVFFSSFFVTTRFSAFFWRLSNSVHRNELKKTKTKKKFSKWITILIENIFGRIIRRAVELMAAVWNMKTTKFLHDAQALDSTQFAWIQRRNRNDQNVWRHRHCHRRLPTLTTAKPRKSANDDSI